ncbi:CPBP family glutamic-type intramembrane protease [Nostoc sp. UHCC 0302]|uniref:CPBP family glutamic-type intramembrane protease n=1 Tax=Nostoc sp. UHCC 0302 TaxID=3134896 RepID=UPI00311CB9F1
MNTLILRIEKAILTIPSRQSWLDSAILLLLFAVISLTIGFYLKFLKFELFQQSLLEAAKIIIISIFTPAITEELFFRVLLLPHLTENASINDQWLWGCLSLVGFVIYHPLEAITVFPSAYHTFTNKVFLLLVTFFGSLCTIIYFQTGSLWTSVFVHWIVVITWLLLLGGYSKLNTQ